MDYLNVARETLARIRREAAAAPDDPGADDPAALGASQTESPSVSQGDALPYKRLNLDPWTLREVLGPRYAKEAVDAVRDEVVAAVIAFRRELAERQPSPRRLIRGHPLADWLDLDTVAELLRLCP